MDICFEYLVQNIAMVMGHILLELFFSLMKNLGRSPKPRAPARAEGEINAKLLPSEKPVPLCQQKYGQSDRVSARSKEAIADRPRARQKENTALEKQLRRHGSC